MVLSWPTGNFFRRGLLLLRIPNLFKLTFLISQFISFWLLNYWQALSFYGKEKKFSGNRIDYFKK